jgi:hypothetical protein
MSSDRSPQLHTYALMGVCLLYVQQAERALASAVGSVLMDPTLTTAKLMGQTEPERKRTLGDFLKELRKLARIEPQFKNKLYRFLTMRNTFIHNLSEVPGWDVRTEEGREVATKFLSELLALAFEVSGVFMSLFTVSAREELGENIIEGNQLMSLIEKQFGPIARKILAARIR